MDEQLSLIFDIGEIESKHHTIINGRLIVRKVNIWDMLFLLFGIRRKYIHKMCVSIPGYLPARNWSWIM